MTTVPIDIDDLVTAVELLEVLPEDTPADEREVVARLRLFVTRARYP